MRRFLSILFLCTPLAAQGVGTKLQTLPRGTELYGLEKTPAQQYTDYVGRAVLIEFFAYW